MVYEVVVINFEWWTFTRIIKHLANFNQPHVQVYVVRILFMVPIYSIEIWLAVRFYKRAVLIETLRDFYEAYVLYSFLQYLTPTLQLYDKITYLQVHTVHTVPYCTLACALSGTPT